MHLTGTLCYVMCRKSTFETLFDLAHFHPTLSHDTVHRKSPCSHIIHITKNDGWGRDKQATGLG